MKIIIKLIVILGITSCLHIHKRRRTREDDSEDIDQNYNFQDFEKKLEIYKLYRGQTKILFKIADLNNHAIINEKEF